MQEIFAVRMMDLQVAIFLLIFLSLSCLATLGICYVEIRSCWRQYRLSIETQRHVFASQSATQSLKSKLTFSPYSHILFVSSIKQKSNVLEKLKNFFLVAIAGYT